MSKHPPSHLRDERGMQTHRLGRKECYSPGLIGSISITGEEVEVEVEGGGFEVMRKVAQCSYSEAEKHSRIKLSHCTHRKRASYLLIFLCR